MHFPLTQQLSSREPLAANARSEELAALPQRGEWKCSSPEQTARASSTMFTSVPVLQLREGDGRDASLRLTQKAQMSGWPLIVLPRPGEVESMGKHLSALVASLDQDLTTDDIGTYDPKCESWAGIRSLTDAESESLKGVLGGKITPASLFEAMKENKTVDSTDGVKLPLGAKLTLQNFGMRVDSSDKHYLDSLQEGGFLQSWTSPVWPNDIEDYSTLFIHGQGHRTGAHIDDSSGGTYFYLKVVTGKKRIRIWPILDPEGLLAWRQAQESQDAREGVEFPFRGFLFNATLSGGLPSRWTERGFEWGLSPPGSKSASTNEQPVHGPLQHAYSCYVEVEVNAGEELFVGSAVPHQVETVEPALAISKNYRFSNFAWMTSARLHSLAEAVGQPSAQICYDACDDITTFDDEAAGMWGSMDAGSSTAMRFRDLWRRGVRPVTRREGAVPEMVEELVRDVMLAWSDPSIAVNQILINELSIGRPTTAATIFWDVASSPGVRFLLAGLIFMAVMLSIFSWCQWRSPDTRLRKQEHAAPSSKTPWLIAGQAPGT